jgi:hypothetical protein
VLDRSGIRVTSGRRALAAATLYELAKLTKEESLAWADACALLIEDGQLSSVRMLLRRVTDRFTAERVQTVLTGTLRLREATIAAQVDDLWRAAVDLPPTALPMWAEGGVRVPGGGVALSRHTLDLDTAESEDGIPWPAITVMVHQIVGTDARVLLEIGPGGQPCTLRPQQARRIAASIDQAATIAAQLPGGHS